MVMDRQKVKTRSEYRWYRVADKLVVNAGRYRVQKQARVKTGRTRKRRIAKRSTGKTRWLIWENIQDELAQRDRKHRDKYTGENKRYLEGEETITGTGETDQGVTLS